MGQVRHWRVFTETIKRLELEQVGLYASYSPCTLNCSRYGLTVCSPFIQGEGGAKCRLTVSSVSGRGLGLTVSSVSGRGLGATSSFEGNGQHANNTAELMAALVSKSHQSLISRFCQSFSNGHCSIVSLGCCLNFSHVSMLFANKKYLSVGRKFSGKAKTTLPITRSLIFGPGW